MTTSLLMNLWEGRHQFSIILSISSKIQKNNASLYINVMLDNYCGRCNHGKGTFKYLYLLKQQLCDSTRWGCKLLGFIHTVMSENHPESMKKM